jgi:hypothetical protein
LNEARDFLRGIILNSGEKLGDLKTLKGLPKDTLELLALAGMSLPSG